MFVEGLWKFCECLQRLTEVTLFATEVRGKRCRDGSCHAATFSARGTLALLA